MSPPRHILHPQFSRRRAVAGLGSQCCGGWIPPGFPPCLTLVQDQGRSPRGTSLGWLMAMCAHRGARAHTRGFRNIPKHRNQCVPPPLSPTGTAGLFFQFITPSSPHILTSPQEVSWAGGAEDPVKVPSCCHPSPARSAPSLPLCRVPS